MSDGTHEYVSSKEKAQMFVDSYAAVSRLPHRREDKDIRRSVYSRLRQQCTCKNRQSGMCQLFTLPELQQSLNKLKPHKAAGSDGISTDPLRHLSNYAKDRLLEVANLSWLSGEIPRSWRQGIIVPILKHGKPANETKSFRPISLTSNIAKVIERLVAVRLSYMLERRGVLTANQTGFRAGRSAEDQVLRLAESVCARFEQSRDKRTVLALVDFSRAFDKVWHIGLTHKLLKAGVPNCCTHWIRQYLSDRRASVRVNGMCSRQRIFRAGVPQGAVLSPLLFIIYINDIVDNMPADVEVSLYADDVALWAGASTIGEASRKVQAALQKLEEWALRWKLVINVEKSEAAAFALGTNPDSLARPVLSLGGQTLKCSETPKFLGMTFDRRMTYRAHVEEMAQRMTSRLRQLRCLAGRSWGCCSRDLRTVYLAYIRSVSDYCGGCFLPAASESTIRHLEVIQRKAARVITGCVASTPVTSLEREANLTPLRIRGQQLAGSAFLRSSTKPVEEPLQRLIKARRDIKRRLKVDRSWLSRGAEAITDAHVRIRDVRRRACTLPIPPWLPWPNLNVRAHLAHQPADATPLSRREAAERSLAELPPADVVAWTDGSVRGNQTRGGAGFLLQYSDGERVTGSSAAGLLASSYAAEITAILSASKCLLRRISGSPADGHRLQIRFCTDSQSALQAIAAGPTTRRDTLFESVWRTLAALSRRGDITLQWVPAHCGVEGNEAADILASRGSSLSQRRVPVAYDAARGAIRRTTRRRWLETPQPEWHRRAAGDLPDLIPSEIPRADAVTVAQLRTGHSVLLAAYRHRLGFADTPNCADCGFDAADTAEHLLLSCPAHHNLRQSLFDSPLLSDPFPIFLRPSDVVAFLRRAGRLRPRI